MNMFAAIGESANSRGASLRVEKLSKIADIEALSPASQALEKHLLVPSGSHLAAWLMPSLRHYSAKHPAEVLALWRDEWLCGLFALTSGGGLVRRSWTSPLSFSGTPLIDREGPQEILTAFLKAEHGRATLLKAVPSSGPFWDILKDAVEETSGSLVILDQWERASFKPKGSFDQWLASNFGSKRSREYRRQRNRLGEKGTVESLSWLKGDPVDPWIDELITLEGGGWKGGRGTALASDPSMAAAFREASRRLAAEGSLRLWKLALDGKPIAMMSGLVSDSHAWLGKTTYDDAFAKYSPGTLVLLDATAALSDEKGLALADSCAIRNHPAMDYVWRDRIGFCDVMIKGPGLSSAAFNAVVMAEKAQRSARATAKNLYYRITRRQRS